MKEEKQQSQYHQINQHKRYDYAIHRFLQEINNSLKKKYLGFTIVKLFGQYVHTRMFMYHVVTNNGDKLTICLSIYDFEPQSFHGFVDFTHEGHMKPMTVQKKLIQLDNWPSCGAFWRSQSCQLAQAQEYLGRYTSQINEKLQLNENSYRIIRCWSQVVSGTNYFMHIESNNGLKASVGMYVPLDYGQEQGAQCQQYDQQEQSLIFQITFCQKGHVNYD